MAPPLVLFVCTGNTCRSPMAAVLARHWLGKKSEWDVDSAGVSAIPGQRASDGAIEAMVEKKLDLADHRSQPLTQARIDAADLVVVMTEAHKRAVILRFPGVAGRVVMLNNFNARHQGEDVPDPFGMKADVYRTIRDEIEAAMPELVMQLRGLYGSGNRSQEGLRS
jgi:protein-tyrosine-phosphatase